MKSLLNLTHCFKYNHCLSEIIFKTIDRCTSWERAIIKFLKTRNVRPSEIYNQISEHYTVNVMSEVLCKSGLGCFMKERKMSTMRSAMDVCCWSPKNKLHWWKSSNRLISQWIFKSFHDLYYIKLWQWTFTVQKIVIMIGTKKTNRHSKMEMHGSCLGVFAALCDRRKWFFKKDCDKQWNMDYYKIPETKQVTGIMAYWLPELKNAKATSFFKKNHMHWILRLSRNFVSGLNETSKKQSVLPLTVRHWRSYGTQYRTKGMD